MGILTLHHVSPAGVKVTVGDGAVVEREQAAAADFFKLLAIFLTVGIEDVAVGVEGLHVHAVQHELIGAGLVAEALALQVDLQERLLAEPEPLAVGLVAGGLGRQAGAAVEHHGGVAGIHLCARPEHRLNAGAVGLRAHGNIDLHLHGLGLQRQHHLGVAGIAAGRHDGALGGLDADVVAVGGILSDDAGDSAGGNIDVELHQAGVAADLTAALFDEGLHVGVEGDVVRLALNRVRAVAGGERLIALGMLLIADAALELHEPVARAFEDVGQPVDQLAGVVDPGLHEVAVDVAAGIAYDLLQGFGLIDFKFGEVLEALKLQLGVDGADVFLDLGGGVRLLDDEDLCALFRGGHTGNPAAGSAADHQNLSLKLFGDVRFRDFGGLAQPVADGLFTLGEGDRLSARLLNAGRGRLTDGVAGDGGAGDGVDIRALSREDRILHLLADGGADARGLAGDVDGDIRDAVGVEGHGDRDVTADALGRGGIGAGGVDALLFGKGGDTGDGGERSGGGAGQSALQKVAAGKFFHAIAPFRIHGSYPFDLMRSPHECFNYNVECYTYVKFFSVKAKSGSAPRNQCEKNAS